MGQLYYDTDLQYIKGVGPGLATRFYKKGLSKAYDLLTYYPRSYLVQKSMNTISSLKLGQDVCFQAQIVNIRSFFLGKSKRRGYEVVLKDSTGFISCFFFRLPYKDYFQSFASDQTVWVTGKLVVYKGKPQFQHPLLEPMKENETREDKVVALYTEIEGISSTKFRKILSTVFENIQINDYLPAWIRSQYQLLNLKEAFRQVHFPETENLDELSNFKTEAQRRLIFDEFFWVELRAALRKNKIIHKKSFPMEQKETLCNKLLKSLSFELTKAQKKVYQEISSDFLKFSPMHRLIQGDVGSGKTILAFMASVFVIENGLQAALMVPTEVLAEQHYKKARELLEPLGITVALLTSHSPSKKQIYEQLEKGEIDFCVGTHALLQEDVKFKKLGLVVIDEQHRFGVYQRGNLLDKSSNECKSHFLVMTATPIPRTLAMTVYADLDISILDELPQGRKPIITKKAFSTQRSKVMEFLKTQLQQKKQAYVVYPLIEESEKIDLRDAQNEYEKLKKYLPDHNVALLHGKMKASEKRQIMEDFYEHKTDVLVSTTVIEVGIDVPRANLMIVEHAERFGLSQLHQLRGRVGRSEDQSYCVLVLGQRVSKEAMMRAEVMEENTDGFKVAEFDLKLRGPGEFLGTKQSGLSGFKMASFSRDLKIIEEAQKAAFSLMHKDPQFVGEQNKDLKIYFEKNVESFVAG